MQITYNILQKEKEGSSLCSNNHNLESHIYSLTRYTITAMILLLCQKDTVAVDAQRCTLILLSLP